MENTKTAVDTSLKQIHIGQYIRQKVFESNIQMDRICNFFHLDEDEINKFYKNDEISTSALLKWSKLLEYDFFRIYTGHLILYSPAGKSQNTPQSRLPVFRKNIYTKEVIDYMMELITENKKTPAEVIEFYGIPKTTLYKWLKKYNVRE